MPAERPRSTVYLALLAMAAAAVPSLAPAADDPVAAKLKAWDPDNDGTLDWAEVKKAAIARFHTINPDNDGTLDAKEAARAKISKKALVAADPDKDGTLDEKEYLSIVEQRFKAADPDHNGTVSLAELKTPAGALLMKALE
ncbi:MAG: hypothetical protein WDO68_06780 [Gammaproteobacteria bacterium]